MKKIIICVCTFLLMPAIVKAQVGKYRSDLAIGVNGGIVMNQVTFNPKVQQALHFGPEYGVSVRYTCEKYFAAVCALQAEINYSNLGWKEEAENGSFSYIRDINYIQIPFLARLGFGRERKGAMAYLILGPQVGFCLNEKDSRYGEWGYAINPYDVDGPLIHLPKNNEGEWRHFNKRVENKFQYGITGGLGVEFSHPKVGHFALDGRYFFGLSDIFNNGKKDIFGRSANSSITIKLSYFFDVRKTPDNNIR